MVIDSRSKLEYSLNYLICRKDNEEKKILLDEIRILVINSLQVSITTNLIAMLIDKKIKVIFVDSKHNPTGEITPYQNNFYSFRKIKEQMSFDKESKDYLWQSIIKKKIENQSKILKLLGKDKEYELLNNYKNEVELGDISNREGHSAKVYFNSLFGKNFNRDFRNNINEYLNYGYSIILSSINREIKILGYLTELGIHHIGESNSFNLSCDFMEPLRPLIDYHVVMNLVQKEDYKNIFIDLLAKQVKYMSKTVYLDNAIHLYVEDLFNYLKTGDIDKIRFIDYGI